MLSAREGKKDCCYADVFDVSCRPAWRIEWMKERGGAL